jgi:hypothetical protein
MNAPGRSCDRDLYISCYNMADGKFTAFPSRAMIGADIREIKLENDSVGQRAYDAIKGSAEGSIASYWVRLAETALAG